jgi:hypothetical protein
MNNTNMPGGNGDNGSNGMGMGGKMGGQEGGRKKTAWMAHVKATMRANKGLKLKQVLKLAKKTYKKSMRGGGAILTPNTVEQGGAGRRRRGSRATRRSRRYRGGEE